MELSVVPSLPFKPLTAHPLSWMNRPDDLVHPLAPWMRCQQVFWSLGLQAYQQELAFIQLCQLKGLEMTQALLAGDWQEARTSPELLDKLAGDVTEHALTRMKRLQTLNEELQDAIWEEI